VGSPQISVVIVTYNTRDLVSQCLAEFQTKARDRGWQTIVVDNGSQDDTTQALQRFPGIQILRSDTNLGYAGGNNLGLRQAHGDVVILMNSDVRASIDILQSLAQALWSEPQVGAMSVGLVTPEESPQAFAFGNDPRPGYLVRRGWRALWGLGAMHDWDAKEPLEVEWVSGACLAVRQRAIQQVGLLDERFFLYFEDNDWCLRMRKAGWHIIYNPSLRVIHLGGASQPERHVANQIYYHSMVAFYAKHYGLLATGVLRLGLWAYNALWSLRGHSQVCA
jgi:N-acetylglucosaminyl-diphospho-decaprenol L-rhamnosyltransferase